MKCEWKTYTVQELVDMGWLEEPMDGNHGSIHPKASDYVSSGVPFIMANDLVDGKVNYNNCVYITEKQASGLRKGFAKPGDVLLTHKATIGRTAIVPDEYDTIVLTPQVTYYRAITGINNQYLKYYFDTNEFQQLFANWAGSGSTRAYLGITAQRKLPIVLPPIEIQNKIVNILSALDDKITLNNKINANLQQQAQAIFKSWFVDFEPFQDGEFVESELGPIPKGWRVGTISDLGTVVGGATPSKSKPEYYTSNGIGWITPKDLAVNKNLFVSHGATDITQEGLKNSSARIMPKGTVLFSSRAPIGYIAIANDEVTTNQGFKSVVPHENIGTSYVYYFLKYNLPTIDSLGSGSTFKEVSGATMKSVLALVPDDNTLRKFTYVCDSMFEKQECLERENSALTNMRDTLLPKLMNGEIVF